MRAPKNTRSDDGNILRLFAPSLLGLILCMVCLTGATWAWYSVNLQIRPQSLTAANFDVSVSIQTENGEVVAEEQNGGYTLLADTVYKVELTAAGTASQTSGYCVVQTGDTRYYTDQLMADGSLSFTLIPDASAGYIFIPVWGSYSGTADISDGTIIGTRPDTSGAGETGGAVQQNSQTGQPADSMVPENIYTVLQGETLAQIAERYGLTMDELAAYNNMDTDAPLQAGQKLKIPDGADAGKSDTLEETDGISGNTAEDKAPEGTEGTETSGTVPAVNESDASEAEAK